MKSKRDDVSVPDELIKNLVEFHGHLGPFLVLGAKAGLMANSMLGKDCFKTKAIVMTVPSPPNSCFVDGVQFTTGCTMGKGNIELRRSKGVSVLFLKENRKLELKLKDAVLDVVRSITSKDEANKVSLDLFGKPASELFGVKASG